MNYKGIILRYIIIILGGFLIFYLDDREFLNTRYTTYLVMVIALVKFVLLFNQSYKKIIEISIKNIPFHKLLIFMFINVAAIIISFAVDFLCLYQIDHSNFIGLPEGLNYIEIFFEFFYLSMLGFNNLGFYDVIPRSLATKFLVMIEIVSYFMTIVFVLSDFVSLKESIIQSKKEKKEK